MLDLLAALEKAEAAEVGATAPEAEERRKEADEIRNELVRRLPQVAAARGQQSPVGTWWYEATMAEAHLGLGNDDEALEALRRGESDQERQQWEYESTVRQLVALARLRAGDVVGLDPLPFRIRPTRSSSAQTSSSSWARPASAARSTRSWRRG